MSIENCDPCKHCQHYVEMSEGDGWNEPFYWWMECEVDSEALDDDCKVIARCPHFKPVLASDGLFEHLPSRKKKNSMKKRRSIGKKSGGMRND